MFLRICFFMQSHKYTHLHTHTYNYNYVYKHAQHTQSYQWPIKTGRELNCEVRGNS